MFFSKQLEEMNVVRKVLWQHSDKIADRFEVKTNDTVEDRKKIWLDLYPTGQ